MTSRRSGWLGAAVFSGAGAGLLGLTAAMNAAFAYGDTDNTLIMGGTEDPTPDSAYLSSVNTDYILPNIAPNTDTTTALTTPEQFFPLPGYSNLTFGQSVAQGLTDLQNAIAAEPAGIDIEVFGYSQSATIATDELDQLQAGTAPTTPSPSDLSFVLVGDPNNLDGGLLERFDGLNVPRFDIPFNGATPDTAYPTDIYTIQYDGFADFPQYPLNILADANAIAGISVDHPDYPTLTPAQVATAIQEPVSPGETGDTNYYMIPTQTLPLVQLLENAGLPTWEGDLINPDLRVLVDLGYGNLGGATDPDYANVPTQASLSEQVNWGTASWDLLVGAEQGATAALVDEGVLPKSWLPDVYPFVPSLDPELSTNAANQAATTFVSTASGQLGILGTDINDALNSIGSGSGIVTDVNDVLGSFGLSLPASIANELESVVADITGTAPTGTGADLAYVIGDALVAGLSNTG